MAGVTASDEIRDFLTSRRARITPEQAGLPAYGTHRRVAGLRREEVALLAGISVEYYTKLERGNATGISESVLEGLVRALQLDEAERTHLYNLFRAAGRSPPRRQVARRPSRAAVRRPLQLILDTMTGTPAYVRNGRMEILAANDLGRALYSPVFAMGDGIPNTSRFIFLDPRRPTSSSTGTASSPTPSRSCVPPLAATLTTNSSLTLSASCPPAVNGSASCGPGTT